MLQVAQQKWNCTFLQTTDMLILYISYLTFITFLIHYSMDIHHDLPDEGRKCL